MKKLLFLLIVIPITTFGQLRPFEEVTAGLLVGLETTTYGFHLQTSNFYLQGRFSTQHRPNSAGYDITHIHNFGFALPIASKIEVLTGVGYNSLWNGVDKKLEWHWSFGMAFRDEVMKFYAGMDLHHDYIIGVLFTPKFNKKEKKPGSKTFRYNK